MNFPSDVDPKFFIYIEEGENKEYFSTHPELTEKFTSSGIRLHQGMQSLALREKPSKISTVTPSKKGPGDYNFAVSEEARDSPLATYLWDETILIECDGNEDGTVEDLEEENSMTEKTQEEMETNVGEEENSRTEEFGEEVEKNVGEKTGEAKNSRTEESGEEVEKNVGEKTGEEENSRTEESGEEVEKNVEEKTGEEENSRTEKTGRVETKESVVEDKRPGNEEISIEVESMPENRGETSRSPSLTNQPKRRGRKRKVNMHAKEKNQDLKRRVKDLLGKKKECRCAVCGDKYDARKDNKRCGRWVGCEHCSAWVHSRCINFTEDDVDNKDFVCGSCI
jgi:hypothetical protein